MLQALQLSRYPVLAVVEAVVDAGAIEVLNPVGNNHCLAQQVPFGLLSLVLRHLPGPPAFGRVTEFLDQELNGLLDLLVDNIDLP